MEVRGTQFRWNCMELMEVHRIRWIAWSFMDLLSNAWKCIEYRGIPFRVPSNSTNQCCRSPRLGSAPIGSVRSDEVTTLHIKTNFDQVVTCPKMLI